MIASRMTSANRARPKAGPTPPVTRVADCDTSPSSSRDELDDAPGYRDRMSKGATTAKDKAAQGADALRSGASSLASGAQSVQDGISYVSFCRPVQTTMLTV